MQLIITKNYKQLSELAVSIVFEQIKKKPASVLGLATGSTPLGLYENLINLNKRKKISFQKIKTFNLDEYYGLKPEHKQSYHYFMQNNLFDSIDIKQNNIHIPDGLVKRKDLKRYCAGYEREIKKAGGIDLQILGIGSNGHIGFNEPGSSFKSKTRLIKISSNTIQDNARFFKNKEEVPKYAVTMGLDTIMKSKKIILLASGKNKAKAVAGLINQKSTTKLPASILKKHPNVTVIADRQAANSLKVAKFS